MESQQCVPRSRDVHKAIPSAAKCDGQSSATPLAELRGEHDAAIALAEQALAIQHRIADRLGAADTSARVAAIRSRAG